VVPSCRASPIRTGGCGGLTEISSSSRGGDNGIDILEGARLEVCLRHPTQLSVHPQSRVIVVVPRPGEPMSEDLCSTRRTCQTGVAVGVFQALYGDTTGSDCADPKLNCRWRAPPQRLSPVLPLPDRTRRHSGSETDRRANSRSSAFANLHEPRRPQRWRRV